MVGYGLGTPFRLSIGSVNQESHLAFRVQALSLKDYIFWEFSVLGSRLWGFWGLGFWFIGFGFEIQGLGIKGLKFWT